MIIADAGPIVSLIAADQPAHRRCVDALHSIRPPMVTTWSVLTEVMHLLGRGGWRSQAALWQLVDRGELVLYHVDAAGVARCRQLMERYRDAPMDLADATLIALAESLRSWRIFTLDQHFRIYRPRGADAFEIIPV